TDQRRSPAPQPGHAVPRAPPHGAGRVDHRQVGCVGEESPGQVLFAHHRRPKTARQRNRRLAEDGGDHRTLPWAAPRRTSEGDLVSRRSVLAARIRALFLRKRLERELDAEIRFPLEMQAEDNTRAGMDSRQATDAASRSFGGVMRTKETYRERRGLPPIRKIAPD